MTAVPSAYGSGVQLICDTCGDVAATDGCGLHDADVVYVAVTAIGWSGSAFARGPHRCPSCPPSAPRRTQKPARVVTDRVDVELRPAAAVVRVRGDLDLDVAPGLRAALERAMAARTHVVVDLSGAGVIDAVGLGALVRARNAVRRRHGELLLAGPSRFVQTVLRTMRLHTAFRSFGTVEQAVAAAHRPSPRLALAGTTS